MNVKGSGSLAFSGNSSNVGISNVRSHGMSSGDTGGAWPPLTDSSPVESEPPASASVVNVEDVPFELTSLEAPPDDAVVPVVALVVLEPDEPPVTSDVVVGLLLLGVDVAPSDVVEDEPVAVVPTLDAVVDVVASLEPAPSRVLVPPDEQAASGTNNRPEINEREVI